MASSSNKVVYAALAANAGIAITKFAAAAVTGSSAMLAEAIHSAIDTGNEALLLVGLRRSRLPPDETHPFGHGKELYFWSLIVAVVIFGLGGGMAFYEGFTRLGNHSPIENVSWSYAVLGVAAVFEGGSFVVALRALMRKGGSRNLFERVHWSKDPSVFTVFYEDSAALAGVLIAFLGIFLSHELNRPSLDAIASILIGLVLVTVAVLLVYESRELLIGESASRQVVASIREIAAHDRAVEAVRTPLTMHLSPTEVLLNIELEFRAQTSAEDQISAVMRIEDSIKQAHPEITRIFIEARRRAA